MMTVSHAPLTPFKSPRALDARMVSSTPTQPLDSRGAYQAAHIIIKLVQACMEVKLLMLGVF